MMKDKIQKYIKLLKSEKERAGEMVGEFAEYDEDKKMLVVIGKHIAFTLAINQAELLLSDHPTGASTEGEDEKECKHCYAESCDPFANIIETCIHCGADRPILDKDKK